MDPPLPLQGSSPGSCCAGLSQQDGQNDHPQSGEDLHARQARGPGSDQQGAELDQGDASDRPDWEGPEPGDLASQRDGCLPSHPDHDGGRLGANSPDMTVPQGRASPGGPQLDPGGSATEQTS
eukprot:4056063-Ditylum_brightwellii.AAC.1